LSSVYFAAKPKEEITSDLMDKIDAYYGHLERTGHLEKIEESYRMYYGLGNYSGHKVHQRGDEGEYLQVRLNHYRSVLNHILVLSTQKRPATQCGAINTDYESMVSARLGNSLVDYYFKQDGTEQSIIDAAETSLITSKAYIVESWDVNKGKEYGANPETNEVIYDGDISVAVKSCLEVVEDIYAETPIWYIFRSLVNRYDLAAQYPEMAEQILNHKPEDRDVYKSSLLEVEDNDLVPVWTFRHLPTPALPSGRQIEFLTSDICKCLRSFLGSYQIA
jgi:hypothetical protein